MYEHGYIEEGERSCKKRRALQKKHLEACCSGFAQFKDSQQLICEIDEMSKLSLILALRIHGVGGNESQGTIEDVKLALVNHLLHSRCEVVDAANNTGVPSCRDPATSTRSHSEGETRARNRYDFKLENLIVYALDTKVKKRPLCRLLTSLI